MKLTTQQIQQIIKEELNNVLYENRKGLPKGVTAESLVSKLLRTLRKKKPSFFSRKKEPTKLEATLTKARIKHLFRFKFRGNEIERDFAEKWIDIFYKDYYEFKKVVDADFTLSTQLKPFRGKPVVEPIDLTRSSAPINIDYGGDRGVSRQERERAKKEKTSADFQKYLKAKEVERDKKNMQNANLPGFDFGRVFVHYGNFQGANLRGAYFSKATITGANFDGADLRLAKFANARRPIVQAKFNRADLSRSHLQGTSFDGVDFIDAKLVKANIKNSNIARVNLTGADLSQSNLEGSYIGICNLSGADLGKANLRNSRFYRSNLRGANFKDAILKGTFFDESEYDDTTIWPDNFKPERRKAVKI